MPKSKIFLITVIFIGALASVALATDLRAVKLKKFLDRYPWSPLRGHEHEILYCADKYGLDYRLYIAIAGAESTYGKRYPKSAKNLTGYGVYGDKVGRFGSIWHNIYETSRLIATSPYYKKYRETKDIRDLIRVYKGVPPYEHYHRNMRYALDQITAVSIDKELAAQRAKLERMARLDPASKSRRITREQWLDDLGSWISVRYDRYEIRKKGEADLKVAAVE